MPVHLVGVGVRVGQHVSKGCASARECASGVRGRKRQVTYGTPPCMMMRSPALPMVSKRVWLVALLSISWVLSGHGKGSVEGKV